MAFFEKLNDIAKNIGDKASETIETTKLNSKISSAKTAIDGIYKKIGEHYYLQYKEGSNLSEEAMGFCAEIDTHNEAINEAKMEIERIKADNASAAPVQAAPIAQADSEIICSACGKENLPGTKFCMECGEKLAAPEKRICSCGAQIPPGVKFCGECGAKFG
ncbi:MAG: zinc ribbon domain-containing protein [Firmicutes bacterium]|nr:zinc ribbon domain-containing protein [Bacillota bacterium]